MINDLTGDPGERVLPTSLRYFFTVLSNLTVYLLAFVLIQRPVKQAQVEIPRQTTNLTIVCEDSDVCEPVTIDFGPEDVYLFRQLAWIVIGIGAVFSLVFYLGIRGAQHGGGDRSAALETSKFLFFNLEPGRFFF